jgi:hypothetical protein
VKQEVRGRWIKAYTRESVAAATLAVTGHAVRPKRGSAAGDRLGRRRRGIREAMGGIQAARPVAVLGVGPARGDESARRDDGPEGPSRGGVS